MKDKMLVYAEGGHKLGLGNIYRSLSLVKALKGIKETLDVTFLTTSDQKVCNLINFYDIRYERLENQNGILNRIIELENDLLLIDFLNIEERFVCEIREKTNTKIVIAGNMSGANKYAHMVINAIINTGFKNSVTQDSNGTLWLKGPKYLVLREEFMTFHHRYQYRGKLERIILLFGGSDQANHTCSVSRALLKYNPELEITAVTGLSYEHKDELLSIVEKHNIHHIENCKNVPPLLQENDFLITSPGTALFEGFFVGLPCLALMQNESQKEVFGTFFMTRTPESILDIGQYVKDIYMNYDNYKKELAEYQIGQGRNDIIQHIKLVMQW